MELILIEDVTSLGKRGQIVKVAEGYGRNYLIPKGVAVPATKANVKMIEQQRIAQAKRDTQLKDEAELVSKELSTLHLVISRRAGETGVLFGSVTTKDLADLLESTGFHVDRRKILLDHPLKQVGNFTLETRPHSEVPAELTVSVIAEEDEPVTRVLKKGEESDAIAAATEAQALEFQTKAATQATPFEEEEKMTEGDDGTGKEAPAEG
jgi:large subunit ribosomal protein L9